MNPFAQGLLQIAQEEGNTLTLEAIRNKCLSNMAKEGYASAVTNLRSPRAGVRAPRGAERSQDS